MTLKEYISGDVEFEYFRDNKLWYRTTVGNFLFPVPVEDIGSATFPRTERGLYMMRYIRKYLSEMETVD